MRKLLWAGVIALCAALAQAQPAENLSQYLRPDHPDAYTVVRGDTLWDISGRFLSKPWVWPELWKANPQIENPHLIYPGDSIHLVYVDGEPRLSLERGSLASRFPSGTEKLNPRIRELPVESAIPAVRLDVIEPFLGEHRVVTEEQLSDAPYVVAGESERIVVGAGDRVYVRGALPIGESFGIFRRGRTYVDPVTKQRLGIEALDIGMGQVVGAEGNVSTLAVNQSNEEIRRGDVLLTTEMRALQPVFFPSGPDREIRGQIVAVHSGVTQVGQWDVVVLNRGVDEGLQVGNVLAVYQRGETVRDVVSNQYLTLPSERAGMLMVFRTFEKMSYGVLLQTQLPLRVLDEVRNP